MITGQKIVRIDQEITGLVNETVKNRLWRYADGGGSGFIPGQSMSETPAYFVSLREDEIDNLKSLVDETLSLRKFNIDKNNVEIVRQPALLRVRMPSVSNEDRIRVAHELRRRLVKNGLNNYKVFATTVAVNISKADKADGLLDLAERIAELCRLTVRDVFKKTLAIGDSHIDKPMLNLTAKEGGLAILVGEYITGLSPKVVIYDVKGCRGANEILRKHIELSRSNSSPLKSKKLSRELSWAVEYALKMIQENKAPPQEALKSALEASSDQPLLEKYNTLSKEGFYNEFTGDLAGDKEPLIYLLFYKEILEFYQILITDLKKENYPRSLQDINDLLDLGKLGNLAKIKTYHQKAGELLQHTLAGRYLVEHQNWTSPELNWLEGIVKKGFILKNMAKEGRTPLWVIESLGPAYEAYKAQEYLERIIGEFKGWVEKKDCKSIVKKIEEIRAEEDKSLKELEDKEKDLPIFQRFDRTRDGNTLTQVLSGVFTVLYTAATLVQEGKAPAEWVDKQFSLAIKQLEKEILVELKWRINLAASSSLEEKKTADEWEVKGKTNRVNKILLARVARLGWQESDSGKSLELNLDKFEESVKNEEADILKLELEDEFKKLFHWVFKDMIKE